MIYLEKDQIVLTFVQNILIADTSYECALQSALIKILAQHCAVIFVLGAYREFVLKFPEYCQGDGCLRELSHTFSVLERCCLRGRTAVVRSTTSLVGWGH